MKYKALIKLVYLSTSEIIKYWSNLFVESDFDLIIPMPANYLRHKQRGFNQSLIIAKYLIKYTKLKNIKIADVLRASVKRRAQADLSINARIKNMKSGFTCIKPTKIINKNVLLIDDVITTGSSIKSAIDCLSANGARKVDVLSLAVSPAFYRNRHRLFSSL
jgi:ComF family protein